MIAAHSLPQSAGRPPPIPPEAAVAPYGPAIRGRIDFALDIGGHDPT